MNATTALFKLDSKNKIRILDIWVEGAEVCRLSGLYGMNLVHTSKVCKSKNVGKANSTTPAEQAEIEATAEEVKKIREGYVSIDNYKQLTNEEIRVYIKDNSLPIPDCMLAKDYKDSWADWNSGIMLSTKLDGMRCMAVISASSVTLFSRGRKDITIMGHIVSELKELNRLTSFTGVLDGELYYHDPHADNFQTIMKACKKYRPGVTEQVEYHVYELIDETLTARERYQKLTSLLAGTTTNVIKLVPQYTVHDYKKALDMHNRFIANGFEGAILKNSESQYRQGARSSDMLKLKVFTEREFVIVDIIAMDNYPTQGKAVLLDPVTGQTFKATPSMTHGERTAMLANKASIIGSTAVIKYFGLTDKKVPRIATLKSIITPDSAEDFRVVKK